MDPIKKNIIHFYNRAGFGIPNEFYFSDNNLKDHIDIQFRKASDIQLFTAKSIEKAPKDLTSEERKKLRMESRHQALKWFNTMVDSRETALVEKMSLFWHGHLACSVRLGQKVAADYINAIRKNALGSYKDLLLAVSKTPAMIRYLNNQQNKKTSPNENFAREVLELFTIGRGNYSEQDIKEAARAFTGWSSNLKAEFVYRKYWHDEGEKTFMGQTGNFDGEDIIDIILEQAETAEYLTRKIYQYFVNEEVPEQRLKSLSKKFYRSAYDITSLMRHIFESKWFYDEENVNSIIKPPVQLFAGLFNSLNSNIDTFRKFNNLSNLLGQKLLDPPNVAGWPGGQNWIDNASLALRINLGVAMLRKDGQKQIGVSADTGKVYEIFKSESKDMFNDLSAILLNRDLPEGIPVRLNQRKSQENFDRLLMALTSQLEFQMC